MQAGSTGFAGWLRRAGRLNTWGRRLSAEEQQIVEENSAARLPLSAAHQPAELPLGHKAAARVLERHRAAQVPLHTRDLAQRVRLSLALIEIGHDLTHRGHRCLERRERRRHLDPAGGVGGDGGLQDVQGALEEHEVARRSLNGHDEHVCQRVPQAQAGGHRSGACVEGRHLGERQGSRSVAFGSYASTYCLPCRSYDYSLQLFTTQYSPLNT